MDLLNSKRISFKASYVVTELTPDEQQRLSHSPGRGIQKVNHVRALHIEREDLPKLQQAIARVVDSRQRAKLEKVLGAATQLIGENTMASPLALAPTFAPFEDNIIMSFSKVLEEVKGFSLEPLLAAYQHMQKVAPIGRLHLERLEMYPVGVEQGELMFTVPMAPGETCTISHKEWSTSSEEYENIVQDFFESYSERGVAEKTDVSISLENEAKHNLALNFGASVSGGYGPVSVTTTFGLSSSSEERESVKHTAQESREITEKASARTRKEHKVSVKLESKKGAEDSSFRTITNTFPDRALRVDYYRLMRKWRTDLYRYGIRLTYDIAIPNPGARFWAKYRQLAGLERELRLPFSFTLEPADLILSNWLTYAADYQASVPEPLADTLELSFASSYSNPGDTTLAGPVYVMELALPEGYVVSSATMYPDQVTGGSDKTLIADIFVNRTTPADWSFPAPGDRVLDLSYLKGLSNRQYVVYATVGSNSGVIEVDVQLQLTDAAKQDWQLRAWEAIRTGAFEQYKQQLSILQDQRDRLYTDLTNKDTLTLRRLEREELLRLVMDWIVGPSFSTAPPAVAASIDTILNSEDSLPSEFPDPRTDLQFLTDAQWANAREFGEFVKFIHEAVEWENILYFLYPYFWGSDRLAREKLLFDHPDPRHRDFLRAGYVRVVIPVRPGYEADFTSLVETGTFTGGVTSPYMTVADEVQAFARTNYSGIPPANPERHARPLLYPQQRTTWETMEKVVTALEQYKITNGNYPPDLATLGGGPYKDAWGRDLVYIIPGSGNDYDLFSYGADAAAGGDDLNADISAAAGASLMASWFDYTPTSGLDIELTAKPALVL